MFLIPLAWIQLKDNKIGTKYTLENTVGTIKNEQSRETGTIEYTRRRKTKQRDSTICVGHQYT